METARNYLEWCGFLYQIHWNCKIMMRVVKSRRSHSSGVTLFELLLCVGLISLIAALAMPFYSNADGARDARDRRNAQTFCSIYAIVQAAGVSVSGEGDAKMEILEALREGITVESGPLRGRTFSVPNLQDDEVIAASKYLQLEDGQLVYDANNQDG